MYGHRYLAQFNTGMLLTTAKQPRNNRETTAKQQQNNSKTIAKQSQNQCKTNAKQLLINAVHVGNTSKPRLTT